VFRFCPGCGHPTDEFGPPLELQPRARRAPRQVPWRSVGASARRPFEGVTHAAHEVRHRVSGSARSLRGRLDVRARELLAALRELARLAVEIVVLSARSGREYLRSMVLLRRLYVRRAAVIYSTGCAALNGEDRGFERARSEIRLLDELISAARSYTAPAIAPDEPSPVRADLPTVAPADETTEESVLMPRGTSRVPALRRGH
jgi:hypothetical protein